MIKKDRVKGRIVTMECEDDVETKVEPDDDHGNDNGNDGDCYDTARGVTVLASYCTLLPYVYLYDVLLVTFSKCQSRWHVTVSTSYIKRTAFLIIVVARIPLRQFYLDYD